MNYERDPGDQFFPPPDWALRKSFAEFLVGSATFVQRPRFLVNDFSATAMAYNDALLAAAFAAVPDYGGVIEFPPNFIFFSAPHVVNKRVLLRGVGGFASRPFFIPAVANDIWVTWTNAGAPAASLTDENQLDGPGVMHMKPRSNRSIRANCFKFVRCDNIVLDNAFPFGFKGFSFNFQRCREPYTNGVRTRFCGYIDPADAANNVPDIIIASTEATGDTSNFWQAAQIFCIYPFGPGIRLDNTQEMNFDKLMVHHMPRANTSLEVIVKDQFGGTLGFNGAGVAQNLYAELHTSPGGAAATVSGRPWAPHFLSTAPYQVRNSNKVKLGRGRILGGATEHVLWADNSEVIVSDMYVEAAATTQYSSTFTVAGNVLTVASGALPETASPVWVASTGTLPAGLARRTTYYVIKTGPTTCSLAATIDDAEAGTPIALSGGSGTHTLTSLGGYAILATNGSRVHHTNTGLNNAYGAGFADDTSIITGAALPIPVSQVVGNPIAPQNTGEQLLFALRNAAMDSTADQVLRKIHGGRRVVFSRAVAVDKAGNASAAVGGIYSGAGKTGNQLIGSGQVYSKLTAANMAHPLTLTSWATDNATALASDGGSSFFFSLTTPGAAGSMADIFIYGSVVD